MYDVHYFIVANWRLRKIMICFCLSLTNIRVKRILYIYIYAKCFLCKFFIVIIRRMRNENLRKYVDLRQ